MSDTQIDNIRLKFEQNMGYKSNIMSCAGCGIKQIDSDSSYQLTPLRDLKILVVDQVGKELYRKAKKKQSDDASDRQQW